MGHDQQAGIGAATLKLCVVYRSRMVRATQFSFPDHPQFCAISQLFRDMHEQQRPIDVPVTITKAHENGVLARQNEDVLPVIAF